MRYLLAVDVGTGSGRAIVFDLSGNQVAIAQEEWHHLPEALYPGSMNFDFKKNWNVLAACIWRVLQKLDGLDICAVSTTSMREAIVLYDKDGNELWACANVDARAAVQVQNLRAEHPLFEREVYEVSGETFALGAIPRLLWLKENQPYIYEQATSFSMLNDWVIAKLTGEIASEPSNAGTTGLLSLETRQWQRELMAKIGLNGNILPEVLESGTRIGSVTKAAAELTGLRAGTPVVIGGGDAQVGCVGLGVVKENQMAVMGGTFWQQEINISEPRVDPKMDIRVNPHVVPHLWQAEAIVFFAGYVMRWFRDTFCQDEIRLARKSGQDTYELLSEQAAQVPTGSYGVIPIFSDVMRFSEWYHAAPSFLNLKLDPQQSSKAVLFRSLLENAAIVTAKNLELVEQFAGINVDLITFAGGAAKSPLWCQIVADATGKVVRVPEVEEATALGAAIIAGVGAGVYSDVASTAEKIVRWRKEYKPQLENKEVYETVKHRWEAAYRVQRELVSEGVTEAMWKAPGF